MQKLKEIFAKSCERRTSHDLNTATTILQNYLSFSPGYLRLMCFYAEFHLPDIVVSHQTSRSDPIFLLQGTLVQETKQGSDVIIVNLSPSPKAYFEQPGQKLYLAADSYALTLTAARHINIQFIVKTLASNLQSEMEFFSRNQYFSKATRITCLKLMDNVVLRQYRKGQSINILVPGTPYLVRKGQLQIVAYSDSSRKSFHELLTFGENEVFGFFDITRKYQNQTIKVSCRSADCLLYCFDKTFFSTYVNILCGDQLNKYRKSIQDYLDRRCKKAFAEDSPTIGKKSVHNAAQVSDDENFIAKRKSTSLLQYLPQILSKNGIEQDRPRSSLQKYQSVQHKTQNNSRERHNHSPLQKQFSSRHLKVQELMFEDLAVLDRKKKKCEAYQALCEKAPQTKHQILYDFFKSDWEATHLKAKQNLLKRKY